MLFLLWADESIHGKLSEDLRKVYFVGRYEYSETVNEAYELLVRNSRQFGGSVLRREIINFGSKRGSSGRISVIFTQERGIGNRGGQRSKPGINLPRGDTVPEGYK